MTNQKHNEFEERVIEQLAELEHQQWVEWAITIMKQEPISEERRERWMKYLCAYNELSEDVKEHDRKWARRVYKVVDKAMREAYQKGKRDQEKLWKLKKNMIDL